MTASPATAAEVAHSIALPYSYRGVRHQSGWAATPTTLAHPYVMQDLDFSDGAPNEAQLPSGVATVYVFRSLLHNYAFWDANPEGEQAVYQFRFSNSLGIPLSDTAGFDDFAYRAVDVSSMNSVGTIAPYGPTQYAFCQDGRTGFYLDPAGSGNASTVTFLVDAASTATGGIPWVFTYRWNGRNWDECSRDLFTSLTPSAGNAVVALSLCGYYAFELQKPSAAAAMAGTLVFQANYTSSGSFNCIRPAPGVEEYINGIQSARVLANSALMTFEGETLHNGGQIAITQFQRGPQWYDVRSVSAITLRSPCYEGPARTGCYGYLKPMDPVELEFIDPRATSGPAPITAGYCDPLHIMDSYIACVVTVPQVENSWPSGKFRFRPCCSIEYKPNTNFLEALAPGTNVEVYQAGIRALAESPQFTENPIHLVAVLAGIGRALATAWHVGKAVAPAMMTAASAIKAGYDIAAPMFRKKAPKQKVIVAQAPPQVVIPAKKAGGLQMFLNANPQYMRPGKPVAFRAPRQQGRGRGQQRKASYRSRGNKRPA